MGQLNLSNSPETGFEAGNWVEAIEDTSKTMFANINPYRNRLLMNKETSELVQQYELQFISQNDFNSFLAQLELRKEPKYLHTNTSPLNRSDEQFRNSPYIYKVRYFENLSVKELCSTVYHGRLYINKIDVRLKELNDIPFHDQLYLYYVCLSGFKILYQKVGVFEINEEMIFFDRQGQVRLWMNPNLSSFLPNYEPEDYNNEPAQNQGSQSQMLKNLMNIIEENTDKQSVSSQLQFKQYLIEKGLFERLSFSKAIEYFGSYCEENQLSIGNYMSSIYELFHQDESLKRSLAQSSQVNKVIYNKHFDMNHFEVEKTLEKTSDPERRKMNYQLIASPQSNIKEHFRNSSHYINDSQPHIKSRDYKDQALQSASITPKYSQQQTSNTQNYHRSPGTFKNRNELKRSQQNNQNSSLIAIIPPAAESRKVIILGSPQQKVISNPLYSHQPTVKLQLPNLLSSKSSNRGKSLGKHQLNSNITFSYKTGEVKKKVGAQSMNQISSLKDQNANIHRKQSIIDQLCSGAVEKEQFKVLQPKQSQKTLEQREDGKIYNYYSATGEYALDKEIADDMIKYLGFNPNL